MNRLLAFILLFSVLQACSHTSDKPVSMYIPASIESSKTDTVFTADGAKYEVKIVQNYTNRCPPSRIYKDVNDKPYYKCYRDMDFDISIMQNDVLKYSRPGFRKADFAKALPKDLQDSAVMNPMSFKYDPANKLFVFGSWTGIHESNSGKEIGLVVNKDFKGSIVVAK